MRFAAAVTAGLIAMTSTAIANPLLEPSAAPFGAPAFDRVTPEHFLPAFEAALAENVAEIEAIATNAEPATFENTIVALERSGKALAAVQPVFSVYAGMLSNDAIQAIEREMSPRLARHANGIFLNPALYARVRAVYDARETLGLDAEQKRLVERVHVRFVRAGAAIDEASRPRFAAINEQLATLSTQFGQNVLADEKEWELVLEEKDLEGLPDFARDAAAAAATARGHEGKYVITLARPSVEPFLTFSSRRDLREQAYKAWIARGDNGDAQDNNAVIAEIVALRAERANLLGYATHSDFVLADRMAATPANARALIEQVWAPARERALEEAAALQEMIRAEGHNFTLEAWDWRYYAEKVRKARFDVNEQEIKPYLQLDNMIAAQFHVANKLFGLTFEERKDIPVWHPDVRVWEVKDATGAHVGVFYGDYFARPGKRSGAWMSALRRQQTLDGDIRPLVANTCNYSRPREGEPAVLSYDDAETLFHEFGHALHGLLSNVTYPSLAMTAVPTDFVEFPAQVYEHWLAQEAILGAFAKHAETGKAMPKEVIQRVLAARTFNSGFDTVEFLASAFVDMDFHSLTAEQARGLDTRSFEAQSLAKIQMPKEIAMRHRSAHFQHIFSGGYSAGYYSYMWSEVLDTDGFDAFRETGDIFNPAVAQRLKDYVYAAGNLRDAAEAYRLFRGRDPKTEPLLIHRGFAGERATQ